MWIDRHNLFPSIRIGTSAVIDAGGVFTRPVCVRGGVRAKKWVRQIVESIEPVQMWISAHSLHVHPVTGVGA